MSKYAIGIVCFILSIASSGQGLMGVDVSPYGGISSVHLQPASLANSPFTFDINLISASASGLIKEFIPSTSIGNSFYQGNHLELGTMFTVQAGNFIVNAALNLPSAMVRLDDKSGIAFSWRIRAVGYGTYSQASMGLLASNDFDVKALANSPELKAVKGVANSWQDLKLSYGRNVYDRGRHKVDIGLSVSYVVGGASGFLDVEDLEFNYDPTSNTLSEFGGRISITYNEQLDEISEGNSKSIFTANGYGICFGVTYEFRSDKYLDRPLDRPGQPNYLFKISTGVRDVGSAYFNASGNSSTFELKLNQPLNAAYFDNLTSISDFINRMSNVFEFNKTENSNYILRLPTTYNLNIDWNIWKSFYANAYADVIAIDIRDDVFDSQRFYNYRIGVRYDKPKYGLYLTSGFNDVDGWSLSLAARYSVLFLGVANSFKFANDDSITSLSLMLALKVPLLNRSVSGKHRMF